MRRRPVIGLPGRRKSGDEISGFPANLKHLELDVYVTGYAKSVLAAGGLPIHLPLDADALHYIELLDALVLTGGADIEPHRYGAETTNASTEPIRDQAEFALLDHAVTNGLPVLGICRGLQLINVFAGGSLHQDVPDHARYDAAPGALSHNVTFAAESTLASIYAAQVSGGDMAVNSLHHQTVDTVGSGLNVTALAQDGTVEGIEMAGADIIAVQWHPEMIAEHDPAFDWLVRVAGNANLADK